VVGVAAAAAAAARAAACTTLGAALDLEAMASASEVAARWREVSREREERGAADERPLLL